MVTMCMGAKIALEVSRSSVVRRGKVRHSGRMMHGVGTMHVESEVRVVQKEE